MRRVAAIALAIGLASCGRRSDYELWRAFRLAPALRVVARDPEGAVAKRVAERLAEIDPRPVERAPLADAAATSAIRIVVGTRTDAAVRDAVRGCVGIEIADDHIQVGSLSFPDALDAVAFFADAGGRPVLGLVAGSDAALASAAAGVRFPERPGAVGLRPVAAPASYATTQLDFFRFRHPDGAIPPASLAFLHQRLAAALLRLDAAIGPGEKGPIEVVLYPSLQVKRALTGDGSLSHAELAARRVHAVETADMSGVRPGDVARIVAFHRLGLSPAAWIDEAIAAWADDDGSIRSPFELARRLDVAGLAGSAADVLDPRARGRRSPLVRGPLAASLLRSLVRNRGVDYGRDLAIGKATLPGAEALEQSYRFELAQWAGIDGASSQPAGARRHAILERLPLRAVAIEWGEDGVDPSKLDPLLGAVRGLGANAVAITALRTVDPQGSPRRAALDAGVPFGPSDAEIEWIATTCHRRDVAVVLRSRLLAFRDGEQA
ncbi:MAG TPA: hypothetical protein VKE69_07195, partial [Planctomycetota bacterium]|nr:hypothetical protein [Planctomycetota bacterium]